MGAAGKSADDKITGTHSTVGHAIEIFSYWARIYESRYHTSCRNVLWGIPAQKVVLG